jgi:hypothetical protein
MPPSGTSFSRPGFLTTALAESVRAARTTGARITVDFARQGDATLVETARGLLGAALADLGEGGDVTLQVHPTSRGTSSSADPACAQPAVKPRRTSPRARECSALVSDLGDDELLVRL